MTREERRRREEQKELLLDLIEEARERVHCMGYCGVDKHERDCTACENEQIAEAVLGFAGKEKGAVRCEDCTKADGRRDSLVYCNLHKGWFNADDFCSYSERRSEE